MKRWILASALAVSLIAAAWGPALADADHGKKTDRSAGGHAAALGKPGDPGKVTRTIKVDMGDDMRFKPANIQVKKGETIKFVVKNNGALKHEMVLGTMKELKEHATLMRKSPGMEHDDPNAVSVEPGKAGTLIWQFTKTGTFDFACLEPGHFEAGMLGKIIVAATDNSAQPAAGSKSSESGTKMTAGVVKKVDKSAGKVTISHGPIEHLDMPKDMTMVFRVKDPAMLDQLKEGDKINFLADKVNGAFTVMRFEPAK